MSLETELKKTIDDLGGAFADFKAANNARLAAIEAKGTAPADLVAHVETANKAITDLSEKIEDLKRAQRDQETLVARLEVFGNPKSSEAREAEVKACRQLMLIRNRRLPPDEVPEPTEADLVAYRGYRKHFANYLRRGGNNGDGLTPEIRNAMTSGADPEGGYNVPPDLTGRIQQLVFETSPMRQLASVQETRSDRLKGTNDLDESGFGWVGEQGSRSDTATPEIGKWEVVVKEMYAQPKATQQDIDDSIVDMESWLVEKGANRMGRGENTSFYTGDGVLRPRGFLTYPAGAPSKATWPVIEQVNTGVNGGFHATTPGHVFHDLLGKVKADYLPNFTWQMNRVTLAETRKIRDGDGTYLWEKSFQANQPFQLLGYGVAIAADMPALATNSLSIAGGDFRAGYQVVDRIGIRVLRDPYTDKPFVKFYMTRRVGGDVVNFEAIKLIKFAT